MTKATHVCITVCWDKTLTEKIWARTNLLLGHKWSNGQSRTFLAADIKPQLDYVGIDISAKFTPTYMRYGYYDDKEGHTPEAGVPDGGSLKFTNGVTLTWQKINKEEIAEDEHSTEGS